MTTELCKARRELGRLKRTLKAASYADLASRKSIRTAGAALQRALARQIKRQELEVRAQALQEKGALVYPVPNVPNRARVWIDTRTVTFDGRNAYVRALNWAERQNRKAGGK